MDKVVDLLCDIGQNLSQLSLLGPRKFAQDKVGIANRLAQLVVGADTQPSEILADARDNRFQAVIAAVTALFAPADFTEIEIQIIADNQDVRCGYLVKMHNPRHAVTGAIVEKLSLREQRFAIARHFGVEFCFFFPF